MKIAPRVVALSDVTSPDFRLDHLECLAGESPPESVLFLVRQRELPVREQLLWGRVFSELAARSGQLFGFAGRLDVARALGARAIHLGHRDVAPSDARHLFPDAWISGAFHLGESVPSGLDALFVSPVFASRKGREALGLAGLAATAAGLRADGFSGRIYALGGVAPDQLPSALESGADGVVVLGLLQDVGATRALAASLTSILRVRTPDSLG